MRMDEVLKNANDFKPIVLLMTPICVCVAYCAMAVAFFVFEFSCLPIEFNDMNWMEFPRFLLEGLAYISFGFAVLLTGYLCVAIDWLNTLFPTRVYVLNEDGKKLYLLYAFDKKTIMCKLENQKKVQEYVPISKQEIINSTIYVEYGNEVLEEVESPHQIENSDNRKE